MGMTDPARASLLMRMTEELLETYGSKAEMSRQLGVHKSQITRWASGNTSGRPSLNTLVRLAKVTNHSLGDMLMAFYDVPADLLMPTVETETVDAVISGPGRRDRMERLAGSRYRMLLLIRDDEPA
jgi:transcriptional regulator with XRE-family HTH domain